MILERGISVSKVSRDLGIHESTLHKWKSEYLGDQNNSFPSKGRIKPERDILKKAIGYLTKE
jgi:transposase-like protein